ncbi:hypothetical protein Glove_437g29 [Diversispora epigaea]|uniref:Peptide-methionine (R)-S-oxide reductase n=1 Tax=Diversispora epigaea TaxID=1348612 RepID=A0A397GU30_9GLOM|nr:hypothetical protein Glove_437g29 [Diversispora epigaea]
MLNLNQARIIFSRNKLINSFSSQLFLINSINSGLFDPLSFSVRHLFQTIITKNMEKRSNEDWQAILTPEQFRVLRGKGTEPANTGEYNKFNGKGIYSCAACNTPLYVSDTKFDSGCGWPAFFDAIPGAINRKTDDSHGMSRIEITCAACDGHLGHVFKGEGWNFTSADERHCVNSVSIKFEEKSEKSEKS